MEYREADFRQCILLVDALGKDDALQLIKSKLSGLPITAEIKGDLVVRFKDR